MMYMYMYIYIVMHGMPSRSMVTNLYSLENYNYLPQAIKDFFNNCTGTWFLAIRTQLPANILD